MRHSKQPAARDAALRGALRSRGQHRSPEEQRNDGTLSGVIAEVESLVKAEAARSTDLAKSPPGVAAHVLSRLQAELDGRVEGYSSF